MRKGCRVEDESARTVLAVLFWMGQIGAAVADAEDGKDCNWLCTTTVDGVGRRLVHFCAAAVHEVGGVEKRDWTSHCNTAKEDGRAGGDSWKCLNATVSLEAKWG